MRHRKAPQNTHRSGGWVALALGSEANLLLAPNIPVYGMAGTGLIPASCVASLLGDMPVSDDTDTAVLIEVVELVY